MLCLEYVLSLHRILKATELFHKADPVSWGRMQGRIHHSNPLVIEYSSPNIYLPLGSHWVFVCNEKKKSCGTRWKVLNSFLAIFTPYVSALYFGNHQGKKKTFNFPHTPIN